MPYVKRAGAEIFYECVGQGPCLVFLHALATNRYLWTHQIFAFARDYKVVSIDLRGHGLSSTPSSGYSIAELSADILAVFDHAEIERAVLVGNSVGGMVAMQTSLAAPDRVRANVILSSGTNLGAAIPDEIMTAYEKRFDAVYTLVLEGAISEKTKRERGEVAEFLDGCYRADPSRTRQAFLASIADPGGVFGWNIRDRLAEIQQPTFLLSGADDKSLPPGSHEELTLGIADAQVKVVPDVGHYYQLERPDDFNRDLQSFLEGLKIAGEPG